MISKSCKIAITLLVLFGSLTLFAQSTTRISVRGKTVEVGNLADDVFKILTPSDVASQDESPDPSNPNSMVVTKRYKVGSQAFEVIFARREDPGPYRVKSILITADDERAATKPKAQRRRIGNISTPDAKSSELKADRILSEQKSLAQSTTAQAARLVREERYSETKTLYQRRWDTLSYLRRTIQRDRGLTPEDKSRVDAALRFEQNDISDILSTIRRYE